MIQETQVISRIPKELETAILKVGRKNQSLFSCKRAVFWEKNVECTASESEDDMSE